MTTAVVFAYHDVGVNCLTTVLSHGIEVPLVVTHDDDPSENIWFGSVMALARRSGIPVVAPAEPNTDELARRVAGLQPDFLFSFYYRNMLKQPLLATARLGALNMHGSLLPKYRGRSPVNWAVINGESETGVTLHYMAGKPDAGDIVDQQAVPILPDDTAFDVFRKITAAAGTTLDRNLDRLIAGTAPRIVQNPAHASYFGGRKPEDGRIDWNMPASRIHNLVRGVTTPYPGALTTIAGTPARVLKTLREPSMRGPCPQPSLFFQNGRCYAQCGDAAVLRLVELELGGRLLEEQGIAGTFGGTPVPLAAITAEHI